MTAIKPNDLDKEIRQALADYTEEVEEALEKVIDNLAKEGVRELKATSPKRDGEYAKNWTRKKKKRGYTLYNRKYQLTHLLEKGHAKQNGGRVEGIPHIAPVEEKLNRKAVSEFKRILR